MRRWLPGSLSVAAQWDPGEIVTHEKLKPGIVAVPIDESYPGVSMTGFVLIPGAGVVEFRMLRFVFPDLPA